MPKEYRTQILTPGNINTSKWYRFASIEDRQRYVRNAFGVNQSFANLVPIGTRFRILCTNQFGVSEIITHDGQRLSSISTIISFHEYRHFATDIEIEVEVEEEEYEPTSADYLRATVFYLTDSNEPVANMTLADIWTYYNLNYKVETK